MNMYEYEYIYIYFAYCYLKTNQGRIVILVLNLYNQLIGLNLQSHKEAYEVLLHFQWDLVNMWSIPFSLQLLAILSHVLLSCIEFYKIIENNFDIIIYIIHNFTTDYINLYP